MIRDAEMAFLSALRENTATMLKKVQEDLSVEIKAGMAPLLIELSQ